MRVLVMMSVLLVCGATWGHVPALLLPIRGTPISSYFIGQSNISRAIYSELSHPLDYFVVQFSVRSAGENSFELLTPVCPKIPSYEEYQPSALLLKGDLPWKFDGESNEGFIDRLQKKAVTTISSQYQRGERPQFYEEFGKQNYWVGAKERILLEAGLYALVVFSHGDKKGNFTLGINESESWSPDLYNYVSELLPKISAGICDPRGFSGLIEQ